MRAWFIAALLLFAPVQAPVTTPVPVLVELFTSEGCSSCPPADRLLTRLVQEQPVAGARIVPLGLHVDYWDQLGWKDPASLGAATERQQAYGRVFGGDRIYTPQMVVDGRDELVGSDAARAKRAIERALEAPHIIVTPHASIEGDAILAGAAISGIPPEAAGEPLEAALAITEDDVTTVVKRGENGGRTLHHDAVVRQLVSLGRVTSGVELRQRVPLRAVWQRDRLHVVVFVQGRRSQRIWGAGTTGLR